MKELKEENTVLWRLLAIKKQEIDALESLIKIIKDKKIEKKYEIITPDSED